MTIYFWENKRKVAGERESRRGKCGINLMRKPARHTQGREREDCAGMRGGESEAEK